METFTGLRSQGGVQVTWISSPCSGIQFLIKDFCCKVNFWVAQNHQNDHQQEAATQETAIQGPTIQEAAIEGATIVQHPKQTVIKNSLFGSIIIMINLSLNELKQKTLLVVTIAMIHSVSGIHFLLAGQQWTGVNIEWNCSTLALRWKFQCFQRPIYNPSRTSMMELLLQK